MQTHQIFLKQFSYVDIIPRAFKQLILFNQTYLQRRVVVNYYQMIPLEVDFHKIDRTLLFGDSINNLIDCQPLNSYEVNHLSLLIQKLYQHYLHSLNPPIGGNWGLMSLSFQRKNGIILYNQFMRLKSNGLISKLISSMPEHFLKQIQIVQPDSVQFARRCNLLNLDHEEVIKISSQISEVGSTMFQLNERVFAKDQYVSEPGSLASDILQEFSYEEYVSVRSMWSEKSLEKDRIFDIPQIPNYIFAKKRVVRNLLLAEESQFEFQNKKSFTARRGRRPRPKREINLMLKLVEANKKKRKKAKRVTVRYNSNFQIVQEPQYRRLRQGKKNNKKKNRNKSNDENAGAAKRKKRFQQVHGQQMQQQRTIEESINGDSNTEQIWQNESEQQRQIIVKRRQNFLRIVIKRISLTDIVYSNQFPSEPSRDYFYIQQQLKHLSSPGKILKILQKIICDSLKSSSNVRQVDILYVRIVKNIYTLLPEQRPLIIQFLKYQIIASFAKLVALVTFFIIDDQEPEKGLLGILIQIFQEINKVVQEFQFKEMTLSFCVDQFFYHYFGHFDNQLEISSYFPIKSLKIIHNSIFEGSAVDAIASCRLSQKLLISQGLLGYPASSTTPTTTCISVYKKYMNKLTNEQLNTVLTLLLQIQDNYPTLWSFEQFSSFLSIQDYDKREYSVKLQSYIKQSVSLYISQQLRLGNNSHKQLLNQILKQTFLSNPKFKQSQSFHFIYLAIVRTMLEFPLFQNQFVYKQVFVELNGLKIDDKNFMMIFNMILQSFQFTVESQKQKFQKLLEKSSDVKTGEYKQIQKFRQMLNERIQSQAKYRQFKKVKGKQQPESTVIQEAYQRLFKVSTTPQMLILKLQLLFSDRKLQQVLSNKNELWATTKESLINTIYEMVTSVDVSFVEVVAQNSDEDDLNSLLSLQTKKKNYSKFILNFITNQLKTNQKSMINLPVFIESSTQPFLLKQFQLHGWKLALKVIISRTIFAQLWKYADYLYSYRWIHSNLQYGIQFNLKCVYSFIIGALTTFIKWQSIKKIDISPDFHQCISHLTLNLSLIHNLSEERDNLIELHLRILSAQVNKTKFWIQFVNRYKSTRPFTSSIQSYMQSFICIDQETTPIQSYLKKSEKYIVKIKSSISTIQQYTLTIIDILYHILKHPKNAPNIEFIISMLRINNFNSSMSLLPNLTINENTYQRLMRFFIVLKHYRNNMYKIKTIIDSFAYIQVQRHYHNLSLHKNSNQYSIISKTHLEVFLETIEQYSIENRSNQVDEACQYILVTCLNYLFQFSGVDQLVRSIICNLTMQRLNSAAHIYGEVLQNYRMQKLAYQYSMQSIKTE